MSFTSERGPTTIKNASTIDARDHDGDGVADDAEDDEADESNPKDDELNPCPDPCPATGCAVPGSGKALSNQLKRRRVDADARDALAMPFGALRDLQKETDNRINQGAYPRWAKRAKLHDIDVRGRKISEGDIVRVAGYFANVAPQKAVRREGKESVNCELTGAARTDIHLNVVEKEAQDDFNGFVARRSRKSDRRRSKPRHCVSSPRTGPS